MLLTFIEPWLRVTKTKQMLNLSFRDWVELDEAGVAMKGLIDKDGLERSLKSWLRKWAG